jgi:phospholipid transport system transporter-binding protein
LIEATERGFRVRAPMTIGNARSLLAAGESALSGRAAVEVDLSPVADVDSAAISVMLGWLRAAGTAQLRFVGAPPALAVLAELYGVSALLPLA